MKVLGLISIIAMVVISYCVYNPMVVDSADFSNAQKGTSSSSACKGPFGVDSQKILNTGKDPEYKIAIVTDIDLEKNDDGTWYVDNCKATTSSQPMKLFFTSPYPQQYELKKGDFIGFTAKYIALAKDGSEEFAVYRSSKILDHISSQSVKCNIDEIRGLSTPSNQFNQFPYLAAKNEFVRVTGVIMAVQTIENEDPEPDNPSDYLITNVVMKCADGNLYLASFNFHNFLATYVAINRHKLQSFNIQPGHAHVNLPSNDAFGEGDVVTVTQTYKVDDKSNYFAAFIKGK